MQIFAKTKNNEIIHVLEAQKKEDYFCIECFDVLHKRSGALLQDHFYHIKPNLLCRQSNKSQEHLQTQLYIKKLFGPQKCEMEKRFDQVNRIADLYVEPFKLVIEIQYSFITLRELKQRIYDYNKLGINVLWILHDKKFNKKVKTQVEYFLRDKTFFYTNINEQGCGIIYDQYLFMKKMPVILDQVHITPKISFFNINLIRLRKKYLPYFFEGDLTAYALKAKNKEVIKKIKKCEDLRSENIFKQALRLLKTYLYLKLEEACK